METCCLHRNRQMYKGLPFITCWGFFKMYIFSKRFDRSIALDENNMNLKEENRSKKRPRLEERGKKTESKLGEKTNETCQASWLLTKQVGNIYIIVPCLE